MTPRLTITDSASNTFLHIIDSNKLQNELLLTFLQDKTGLKGKCWSSLDPECLKARNAPEKKKFILIDCKGIEIDECWAKINALKASCPSECFIALCNVSSKMDIEKTAMSNGIRGVFFDNDSPETISKGIFTILKGDFWYSRKTLTKFLLESKPSAISQQDAEADDLLTLREREILTLIASGQNSRELSDTLCISVHTVKTHIYNIYHKINVNNRLQATLWAAKHL